MPESRLLIFLFMLALLAESGRSQSSRTTKADKTPVEALRTQYAGATVDDMAKMHSVTGPNFYAFDGGTSTKITSFSRPTGEK